MAHNSKHAAVLTAKNGNLDPNIDGTDISIISIDDLIENKRATGRPQDVADAVALEKWKNKTGNKRKENL